MPAINVSRVTVTVGWVKCYRTQDTIYRYDHAYQRAGFFSPQESHVRNLRKREWREIERKKTWNETGTFIHFYTMILCEIFRHIMNRLFISVFVLICSNQRWTRWYYVAKVFRINQGCWIVTISFHQINHVRIYHVVLLQIRTIDYFNIEDSPLQFKKIVFTLLCWYHKEKPIQTFAR